MMVACRVQAVAAARDATEVAVVAAVVAVAVEIISVPGTTDNSRAAAEAQEEAKDKAIMAGVIIVEAVRKYFIIYVIYNK